MTRTIGWTGILLATGFSLAGPHGAWAQSPGQCSLEPVSGAAQQTLHCGAGIDITTERGASFQLLDRNHDGRVDGISLRSNAAVVDVDSKRVKGGFEVVTPQAIAAVRGTRWAVDVQDGNTAVLVLRGRVAVRRPDQSRGVTLGVGQGVDVKTGSTPLLVKRWPARRVSALLARLGQ